MQASLSTVSALSKEKTLQADQCFIAKLSDISREVSNECHNKMSSSYTQEYTHIADDAERKLETLLKDRKKEKKQVEECHLKGEALINAYFEKIDRRLTHELSEKREKIKQACKREFHPLGISSTLEDRFSKEKSEYAPMKARNDLKKFVLEHPGEEILVRKNAFLIKQKQKEEQKQEAIQAEQVSQEAIQAQAKRGMALLKTSDPDDDFKKQVNSTVRTSSSFFSASPPSVSENEKDKLSSKTGKVKQKI